MVSGSCSWWWKLSMTAVARSSKSTSNSRPKSRQYSDRFVDPARSIFPPSSRNWTRAWGDRSAGKAVLWGYIYVYIYI
jgi:hypothetical protein